MRKAVKKSKKILATKFFLLKLFPRRDLIKELSENKATVSNDIPVSVLKESISAYYEKLTNIFNNCIRSGTFPEILKKAKVTPVFKKGDPTSGVILETEGSVQKIQKRALFHYEKMYKKGFIKFFKNV